MSNEDKKKSNWDKVPLLQKIKSIKHIELIIVAIFVLVLGCIFFSSSNTSNEVNLNIGDGLEEYGNNLEQKLTNVISKINGVGEVSVMITFDGRITYEYATESEEITTSSTITSGTNTKTTKNEKVIIVNQNGKNTPLIVREIYPDVAGVLVVASGAESVAIRLNIISAVQTLLGVEDWKIQVLSGYP